MTITTTKGHRHPKDIVIHYNDKVISPYELMEILILFWNNEDTIRPPPDKGAKMMLELIEEVFETRELTDEIVQKYHLTKKI